MKDLRKFSWLLAPVLFGCVEGVSPPALGVFSITGLVVEVDGILPNITGSTTSSASILLTRVSFARPFPPPSYLDGLTPPNCTGVEFTTAKLPGGNATDGGNMTFAGLQPTVSPTVLVDLLNPMMAMTSLTGDIVCSQGPDDSASPGESNIRHDCNVPTFALLAQPMASVFGPGTSVNISVTGGSETGDFSVQGLPAPAPLRPAGAFNPNAIDLLRPVIVEWTPIADPGQPLAMIEILAVQQDATGRSAQILCFEPMASGRKEIPAGALALIPTPTPSAPAPVLLNTSIAAVTVVPGSEGWGSYLVGIGRGTIGQTVVALP